LGPIEYAKLHREQMKIFLILFFLDVLEAETEELVYMNFYQKIIFSTIGVKKKSYADCPEQKVGLYIFSVYIEIIVF
jgi:hypothetical protein